MTTHYRTQGIILKKGDSLEADRVFTVFTKDFGKLALWAVSERKITSKLRSGLELFYLSDLGFIQGKTRKTITDALTVRRYPILHASLERLRIMARFGAITDELVSGQERDEKIWQLLKDTLETLDSPTLGASALKVLAYYFLWNLLAYAGYAPQLRQISSQDRGVADFIRILLSVRPAALRHMDTRGINETLLQAVSEEHLSRVLQS